MNNKEILNKPVRPELVEGFYFQGANYMAATVHGSTGCAYAVGANAPYSYGLPLAGTPRTVYLFSHQELAELA
jgi:hypothetical protein